MSETAFVLCDEPDTSWHAQAACRGTDPELFFPSRGDRETTLAAKAVCAGCPVKDECLAYALANGEKFGIWGGLSERQRRSLRRADFQPIEHGTPAGYAAEVRRGLAPCLRCRRARAVIEWARRRTPSPAVDRRCDNCGQSLTDGRRRFCRELCKAAFNRRQRLAAQSRWA